MGSLAAPAAALVASPAATQQLAPAVDAVRLVIHVLAAAVWVGGQITLAGLVPTARRLGADAPRALARAFARVQWPAYVVLLGTGIWNVAAVGSGAGHRWQVVLGVKVGVVLLAGIATWLHTRATTRGALAAWGATGSLASIVALALGVVLSG